MIKVRAKPGLRPSSINMFNVDNIVFYLERNGPIYFVGYTQVIYVKVKDSHETTVGSDDRDPPGFHSIVFVKDYKKYFIELDRSNFLKNFN